MSSEEVFKVTSFHPPAVKTSSTLCAIRCKFKIIVFLIINLIKILDNFLPDSVDKSSGTLSVSQSGEVNLSYSGKGNRNCKVIIHINFNITNGRENDERLFYLFIFSLGQNKNGFTIRAPGFVKVSSLEV